MNLEARNLVKEYARRGQTFQAVQDVTLSVPKGKITVIMGRSGSGKSTLLNILTGMIRPDSGEVLVDGQPLGNISNRELRELRARKFGIVPQTQSLIGGLSLEENIRLQSTFAGSAKKKGTAREEFPTETVRELGLEELLKVLPHRLSGGEMKRAAIARALACHPDYIFADEPTGELDTENTARVMELFRNEARRGAGILLITHDRYVADHADILYQMENGCCTRSEEA